MTRRLLVLLSLPLAACAEPAPAPPAAPSAPSAPPATAPAPAKPDGAATARVVEVKEGLESIPDRKARVVFSNTTARPCRFLGYKLTWPGASKAVKLDGFTVPPGETRERTLKVHAGDGAIDKLTPESAAITVEVECGG